MKTVGSRHRDALCEMGRSFQMVFELIVWSTTIGIATLLIQSSKGRLINKDILNTIKLTSPGTVDI
jgi:hypothetical protein